LSAGFTSLGPASLGLLASALATLSLRARSLDASIRVRGRLWGPERGGAPAWFGSALARAEIPWDREAAWPWARRGAVAAGLMVSFAAPILGAVVAVVIVLVRVARPRLLGARQAAACTAALPGVLEALSASMASGSSLAQAIDDASERSDVVGRDLALVSAHHHRGTALQEALDRWAERRPGTGVELVADALALAGSSGGSQARALQGVGDTLRERETLAREVRALASQAQMSAAVLVCTPIGFAAVVAALDPRVGAFLLATPLGWACVAVGLSLDLAGGWWMRHLVGRVA